MRSPIPWRNSWEAPAITFVPRTITKEYTRRMYKRFAIGLLCFSIPFAVGQTAAPPAFEVASVKQVLISPQDAHRIPETVEVHPGNISMRNVLITSCIKWAYEVQLIQISGREKLSFDRYEILAKAEKATPVPQMRLMMQVLLADRFKLEAHRETKETRAYALVVSEPSPRLHASGGDVGSSVRGKNLALAFGSTTMLEFADFLSMSQRAPVIDKTGLQGRFDFDINITPIAAAPEADQGGTAFVIAEAIQRQLGLKLESIKVPIEMLVIDRIAKAPTGN
jgi:uncharacterized protein (TIGR03435 family)